MANIGVIPMGHSVTVTNILLNASGNSFNSSLEISRDIPMNFHKHFIRFLFTGFKNGKEEAFQPIAGTATVEASDNGLSFGSIDNGIIDFSNKYNRPNVLGLINNFNFIFNNLQTTNTYDSINIRVEVHSYN